MSSKAKQTPKEVAASTKGKNDPLPNQEEEEEEEEEEEQEDYADEAEDLAEAYDGGGGGRVSGGGGGGSKGAHGGHNERRTLHSGKGTRHKLEVLEKAKRAVSPPAGKRASPAASKDKPLPSSASKKSKK